MIVNLHGESKWIRNAMILNHHNGNTKLRKLQSHQAHCFILNGGITAVIVTAFHSYCDDCHLGYVTVMSNV